MNWLEKNSKALFIFPFIFEEHYFEYQMFPHNFLKCKTTSLINNIYFLDIFDDDSPKTESSVSFCVIKGSFVREGLLGEAIVDILSFSSVDLGLLISVKSVVALVPHSQGFLEECFSQVSVPVLGVVVDKHSLVSVHASNPP